MRSPRTLLTADERARLPKRTQPRWMAPMLATLTDARFSRPDWIYERKFDGERALAFVTDGHVRLLTRNRKEIAKSYPEIATALGKSKRAFVADGEIVAFEGSATSFPKLQARMQVRRPDAALLRRVPVHFYLFDLLWLDGVDLTSLPCLRRKQLLKRAVRFGGRIRYTSHRRGKGEAYLPEACRRGWEGLIAKRAAAPYRHRRSTDWLKFKCAHGQELVIGGFTEPRGSRRGFGALLVGYFEKGRLRYAGKVGTGFDDAMLGRLRARMDRLARARSPFVDPVGERHVHWVRPVLVGEFGFTEWTRAGRLRHPRFLGLRRDKKAADIVRETPRAGGQARPRQGGDRTRRCQIAV